MTKHQKDCDGLLLPLSHAYNAQAQQSARILPFSLALTWKPRWSAKTCPPALSGTFNADAVLSHRLRLLYKATLWKNGECKSLENTGKLYSESWQARTLRVCICTRWFRVHWATAPINPPSKLSRRGGIYKPSTTTAWPVPHHLPPPWIFPPFVRWNQKRCPSS